MDMSLSKLRKMVKDREVWHVAVYEVTRVRHERVAKQQQIDINLAVIKET